MAFDQYGQIIRRAPRPIPIQENTSYAPYQAAAQTGGYTYYRYSLWDRFSNFITGIGNWIAGSVENIVTVLTYILIVALCIGFIYSLTSLGWFWGIVVGIFTAGIAYYVGMAIVAVSSVVFYLVLAVFRYIFYSGVTFLIALALAATITGLCLYQVAGNRSAHPANTETQYVARPSTKYRCTSSSVLNIRSAPNTSSKVVGTLKRGETVDVFEISDGFALIEYNGQDAYVSTKYISRIE